MSENIVSAGPTATPAYKDIRGTWVIVGEIFNLLLMGNFPGQTAPQLLNALQFLKSFREKVESEMNAHPDAPKPEVLSPEAVQAVVESKVAEAQAAGIVPTVLA